MAKQFGIAGLQSAKPAAPLESCAVCRFYLAVADPGNIGKAQGVCRRYPPGATALPLSNGQLAPITLPLPVVAAENWCGEYQARTAVELT